MQAKRRLTHGHKPFFHDALLNHRQVAGVAHCYEQVGLKYIADCSEVVCLLEGDKGPHAAV